MLEAGILTIGVVYMVATLVADMLYSLPESADPLPGRRMSIDVVPVESAGAVAAERTGPSPRGELLREIVRSKTFIVGAIIVGFWIVCAIFGYADRPTRSDRREPHRDQPGALQRTLVRYRSARARHVLARDHGRAQHPHHRPAGGDPQHRARVGTRPCHGVLPRGRRRVDRAASLEAFLALPLVVLALTAITAIGASNLVIILVIALVFTPLIARTVRTSVLLERELDYVAAARLRGEKPPYIMFVEILPNVMSPIIVEFTVRIGYAVFAIATLSFLGFGVQPPSPDWALDINTNFGLVSAGYWWEVLFDALALASLVIGVNLIADAVEGAIDQ